MRALGMRSSTSFNHQPQASTSGRLEPGHQPSHTLRSQGRRQQVHRAAATADSSLGEITLLDYGAGNVRSVRNAIKRLGYTLKDVSSPGCCFTRVTWVTLSHDN